MSKIKSVTIGIGDNVMTGDKAFESIRPVMEITVDLEEGDVLETVVSEHYPKVAALWDWQLFIRLSALLDQRRRLGRRIEPHIVAMFTELYEKHYPPKG
jgi:hypothetical protein